MRSLALLAVAALLVACGGDDSADEPTEQASAESGPLISILPADGVVGPVEFPESFPADLALPAGVEYDNIEAHAGGTTTIYELTGWYDGDPIRAARDYERALLDDGFEITSRTEAPDSLFFVAESADWYVSAGFFPDPIRLEGSSVGITVAPGD